MDDFGFHPYGRSAVKKDAGNRADRHPSSSNL
jgi:hypothetical protein